MVVSDSATTRRILVNALAAAGCDDVLAVADGREAAEAADASVAAIVTDWGLPGLNGIELARLLRSREECAGVRILMVTSRNARADVERAIDSGVDVYLLKPFTPDSLRAKIDELIQPLLERMMAENGEAGSDAGPEARAA